MKFLYEYRTSDNVRHKGSIEASNRDAAFALLKSRGIRPGSVVAAPGVWNLVFGRGKRWMAIAVLSVALAAVLLGYFQTRREVRAVRPPPNAAAAAPRHFVEMEVSVADLLAAPGERYLAAFALPGKLLQVPIVTADELKDCLKKPLLVEDGDSVELRELKGIVAGMKDDLRAFLDSDYGTAEAYMLRLEERQAMEADYRLRIMQRYRAGMIGKDEANAILAAMGLEGVR